MMVITNGIKRTNSDKNVWYTSRIRCHSDGCTRNLSDSNIRIFTKRYCKPLIRSIRSFSQKVPSSRTFFSKSILKDKEIHVTNWKLSFLLRQANKQFCSAVPKILKPNWQNSSTRHSCKSRGIFLSIWVRHERGMTISWQVMVLTFSKRYFSAIFVDPGSV